MSPNMLDLCVVMSLATWVADRPVSVAMALYDSIGRSDYANLCLPYLSNTKHFINLGLSLVLFKAALITYALFINIVIAIIFINFNINIHYYCMNVCIKIVMLNMVI